MTYSFNACVWIAIFFFFSGVGIGLFDRMICHAIESFYHYIKDNKSAEGGEEEQWYKQS